MISKSSNCERSRPPRWNRLFLVESDGSGQSGRRMWGHFNTEVGVWKVGSSPCRWSGAGCGSLGVGLISMEASEAACVVAACLPATLCNDEGLCYSILKHWNSATAADGPSRGANASPLLICGCRAWIAGKRIKIKASVSGICHRFWSQRGTLRGGFHAVSSLTFSVPGRVRPVPAHM